MKNSIFLAVTLCFFSLPSTRAQEAVKENSRGDDTTLDQPRKIPAMDSQQGVIGHGGATPLDHSGYCQPPCAPQPPCGPPGRFWVDGEYLLWWTKGFSIPPLVTTGPASSAGILGRTGTVVVFGDSKVDENPRSGLLISGGVWLDDCHTFGIEAGYFFLESRGKSNNFAGTGAPGSAVLARPFFNVVSQMPDSEIDAFPGVASGTKDIHTSSFLQGAEANGICNLCCCGDWCGCGGYRVDLLAGFRYLHLDEDLEIRETVSVFPQVPFIGGTAFNLFDEFETRNHFYGGQIGARAELYRSGFFVDVIGKVALGVTEADIDVNGATQIITANHMSTVGVGGLLAQRTNIGHFDRDEFAVVPEATINFGYQVNCHVRVYVGYTFLYWSSVFRPGDQIDLALNPTLFPTTSPGAPVTGPLRPVPVLRDTDFWAQGVNFGLEFRY
jgi:hypothetical protein